MVWTREKGDCTCALWTRRTSLTIHLLPLPLPAHEEHCGLWSRKWQLDSNANTRRRQFDLCLAPRGDHCYLARLRSGRAPSPRLALPPPTWDNFLAGYLERRCSGSWLQVVAADQRGLARSDSVPSGCQLLVRSFSNEPSRGLASLARAREPGKLTTKMAAKVFTASSKHKAAAWKWIASCARHCSASGTDAN